MLSYKSLTVSLFLAVLSLLAHRCSAGARECKSQGEIITVDKNNFYSLVHPRKDDWLLYFHAPWYGTPCMLCLVSAAKIAHCEYFFCYMSPPIILCAMYHVTSPGAPSARNWAPCYSLWPSRCTPSTYHPHRHHSHTQTQTPPGLYTALHLLSVPFDISTFHLIPIGLRPAGRRQVLRGLGGLR